MRMVIGDLQRMMQTVLYHYNYQNFNFVLHLPAYRIHKAFRIDKTSVRGHKRSSREENKLLIHSCDERFDDLIGKEEKET